jgi:predicted dehydrogenase
MMNNPGWVPSQNANRGKNPVKKIRLGVIGTGNFAEVCHLPGLKSHPQAEVVALCGRTYERARLLADSFAIPDIYTDYDELCRRDDLDGVTVVSATSCHAEQAIAALKQGKHVFCEKPLGVSVSEATEMTRAAEKSDKVHQVAFTFRYGHAVQELRRRVRAGDIGKPFYARIQYDSWDGLPRGRKIGRPKTPLTEGGLLFDLGSHLFDVVRFVLGPIDSVAGFVHRMRRPSTGREPVNEVDMETHELVAAWFTQPDGIRGQWFLGGLTPPFADYGYLEVIGFEGALKASLSRGTIDILKVSRPAKPDWEELPLPAQAKDGKPHCLTNMMHSFVQACLRGSLDLDLDASFHDGVAAQECMEAILQSTKAPSGLGAAEVTTVVRL